MPCFSREIASTATFYSKASNAVDGMWETKASSKCGGNKDRWIKLDLHGLYAIGVSASSNMLSFSTVFPVLNLPPPLCSIILSLYHFTIEIIDSNLLQNVKIIQSKDNEYRMRMNKAVLKAGSTICGVLKIDFLKLVSNISAT